MRQAVEGSLKRMGTDYIDLLWVHAWDFTAPVEEVMRGLDDLVRAGKVLYLGISDAPSWVVAQANTIAQLRGWTPFTALQVPYSLIERSIERELLPMAESLGVGVTPWAPIGGGILTGKYTRKDADAQDSKRSAMNESRRTEENLAIARVLDEVADDAGCTSAQAAVAWVRQQSPLMVPIVGARKVSQIEDLLGSVTVELDAAQRAKLNDASKIDLGFPGSFLTTDYIRTIVYGDTLERLELPPAARVRGEGGARP
jgi:aryl-alcohol dehydrogenase-like predicted oxidoreductase